MIIIEKIVHRRQERIKIASTLSRNQVNLVKQIEGRRWSRTMRCWHIPYTKFAYRQLKDFLGEENLNVTTPKIQVKQDKLSSMTTKTSVVNKLPKFIEIQGKDGKTKKIVVGEETIVHQLNEQQLGVYVPHHQYSWKEILRKIQGRVWDNHEKYWIVPYTKESLEQLRQIRTIHFNFVPSSSIPNSIEPSFSAKKQSKQKKPKPYDLLNNTQKLAITALEEMLIRERKSWRTIKSYRTHLIGLLRYYPNDKPSQISNQQLKKYLLHKITNDKIAVTTQGQILNAFVAFYKRLLNQEEKTANLYRPKKPKKLPNIFSKKEMKTFLTSIDNLKHKTMMILAYSAGLRKSEIINLRKKDILFDRKCIFVKQAKGKKDRYVMLADNATKFLKSYLKVYQPRFWLFEGSKGGQYSERSLQSVFTNAKVKSGVNEGVTLHGLRHSFATHLVDNGVPLHVVKDLLGHNSIKTTEVYLHISKNYLNKVKSPLEQLDL